MGEPVPISLGLRSNPARNPQAGNCRLINCSAVETSEDGKVIWTLYGTPGLRMFGAPLDGGTIRGMIWVGVTLYVVAGRNIYTVNATGVSTRIGGIPTDGPVYMEQNRKDPPQIGIVSDGLFFVIDTTANSVTQVNDPDLPAPISLSVLDGYGILPIAGGHFMLTAIDDFTQIDGLDEGNAEAYPDEIVRSAVLEQTLVLFGARSTEWHADTGDADFPFERVHATELGCLAGDSVAKVDTADRKTLIWVAPDHTVRAMSGYSGQVISTDDISTLIKKLHDAGRVGELSGIAWADSGTYCYALSCADWTRVFSSKTSHWHEQKSYGLARWRVSQVTPFGTKLIAGDYLSGQLYELRRDTYDEAGQPLIAEVITPHVGAFPYPIVANALHLDIARGVGQNSALLEVADPKIFVSLSKDSGASWSAEYKRSMGRLGRSAKRVKPITRMGRVGQAGAQFRFRIPAPVERVVMAAALDFDRLAP